MTKAIGKNIPHESIVNGIRHAVGTEILLATSTVNGTQQSAAVVVAARPQTEGKSN